MWKTPKTLEISFLTTSIVTFFDLLKQVPQIVIVKRKGPDQQGVENYPATPDVGFSAIVFLAPNNLGTGIVGRP